MGGQLKTKAFTLIELLAIIVILAIIAVITVPIILSVIDNAKRGSIIDSAYGYKDAVNKYYIAKLSEDTSFEFNDGTYLVSELKGMGITVSGNEPTDDSWVVIKGNQVYDFSLKFDDYVANYEVDTNEVSAIKNGTIELTPEVQAEHDRINNIKTIVTAYIEEALTKNSSLESETVKSVSDMTDVVIENGPVEGWVHFDVTDDGVVIKDYSLKVDNYVADYSEDITVTKGGTLRDMPIVRTVVRTIDGVGYYNTEWIGTNPVYYNPVTGESCTSTDYHEDNSKNEYKGLNGTGNQTECLKWYAYSEQSGQVNLLLDHNTTSTRLWVSSNYYNKSYDAENGAQSLGITYPNGVTGTDPFGSSGNWNKGPITLLSQLKIDTSGWSEVLNRTDSYTNSNDYNSETVIDRYTINYSGYKARIITAQEVAYIVGNTTWDETSKSSENSQGISESSTRTYGWLYDRTSLDCETYGCLNISNDFTVGYWTVSSSASSSNNAWHVAPSGGLGDTYVGHGYVQKGLRPVITVSKSSIFES